MHRKGKHLPPISGAEALSFSMLNAPCPSDPLPPPNHREIVRRIDLGPTAAGRAFPWPEGGERLMTRTGIAHGSIRRASWLLVAVTAMSAALLLGTVGSASAALPTSPFGPAISSDKLDYAPGEHVVLNGGGWQPGETVSVYVEDSQNQTWFHNVDV